MHGSRENKNAAKLSEDDVVEIKRKLRSGVSMADLAYEYCVGKSTIARIKNRVSWIENN